MNRKAPFMAVVIFIVSGIIGISAYSAEIKVNEKSGKEYKTGLELYNKGQYQQALASFQSAYKSDDRNVAALFAIGLVFEKQKKFADAADIYKTVLEKDPTHKKALRLYPSMLIKTGDTKKLDEAVTLIKKVIEKNPEQPDNYETLSFVYREQKKYEEALSEIEKAIAKKPGDTGYVFLKAKFLADMGKMSEANNTAREILAKDPSNAKARVICADYLRITGKLKEALAEYATASKNLEVKTYAEHYIQEIKKKIEDEEIEKEYEASQKVKK